MKDAMKLTAGGVRGRLRRYGLELAELDKGTRFRVYRTHPVADFASLESLRAFLLGAETVIMLPDDFGDEPE